MPQNGGQPCLGPSQQKMDCNAACPGESLEFIIRGARIRLSTKKLLSSLRNLLACLRVPLCCVLIYYTGTSLNMLNVYKQAAKMSYSFLFQLSRRANDRRGKFCHRETILLMPKRDSLDLRPNSPSPSRPLSPSRICCARVIAYSCTVKSFKLYSPFETFATS